MVNKALSTSVLIPFLSCAIHRSILAVKYKINQHKDLFNKVRVLRSQQTFVLLAERFRKLISLCTVGENHTHWTPAYSILKMYTDLQHFLLDIYDRLKIVLLII